ncbi:unnamed protein product [Brassica napus]|uniref:(rape) hypothetical protein n=1 Tax=Brassica napus TaxID=3708 RepID=A0A816IH99_BRANA|nr:unnamed protein product [Brassica napus]
MAPLPTSCTFSWQPWQGEVNKCTLSLIFEIHRARESFCKVCFDKNFSHLEIFA